MPHMIQIIYGYAGGLGNTMMSSFSGAFMIAGGSGISYVSAAVEELLQKAARNTSSVTVLDLIWVVRHPGEADIVIDGRKSHLPRRGEGSGALAPRS